LLVLIIGISYIAFAHWQIVPPVIQALLSFAVATPLALLRRSLSTSAALDTRVAELASANEWFPLTMPERGSEKRLTSNPASLIARLTGATAVGIYFRRNVSRGRYQQVASHGSPMTESLTTDELRDALSVAEVATHNFQATSGLSETLLLTDQLS